MVMLMKVYVWVRVAPSILFILLGCAILYLGLSISPNAFRRGVIEELQKETPIAGQVLGR